MTEHLVLGLTERIKKSSSQSMFEAMSTITKFYKDQLKSSEGGINYLKNRGLTVRDCCPFWDSLYRLPDGKI